MRPSLPPAALLTALLLVPAVHAQPAPRVQVRLAADAEVLPDGRGTWQQQAVAVGYRFRPAVVLAEAGRVVRYGFADAYVAAEAHPAFGPKTYGYVRVRVSPGARVSPRLDAHAEAFRTVGGGAEVSVGARTMQFEAVGVTMATGSVAVTRGPWRASVRGAFVPAQQTGSGTLAVRRTFRDAPAFFAEALAGAGEELLPLSDGTAALRPTRTAAVRVSVPVAARVAVEASAGLTHESGFTRRGGGLGLAARF